MELAARKVDFIVAGALYPDAPAVRFHDAFGKRQSQPCAAAFETGLAGGVLTQLTGLVELGEDQVAVFGGYAHARITDCDLYAAFRGLHCCRVVVLAR